LFFIMFLLVSSLFEPVNIEVRMPPGARYVLEGNPSRPRQFRHTTSTYRRAGLRCDISRTFDPEKNLYR
jgi:hypothetical protein